MHLSQVILASSLLLSSVLALPAPGPTKTKRSPSPASDDDHTTSTPTMTQIALWARPNIGKSFPSAAPDVFPNIGKMPELNEYPAGGEAVYLQGLQNSTSKTATYTIKDKVYNDESSYHEQVTVLDSDKNKIQVDILDCDIESALGACTLTQSVSTSKAVKITAAPSMKMKMNSKVKATANLELPSGASKELSKWNDVGTSAYSSLSSSYGINWGSSSAKETKR